jgi:hypothetical protein
MSKENKPEEVNVPVEETEPRKAEPSRGRKVAQFSVNLGIAAVVSVLAGVVNEFATRKVNQLLFPENN